MDVGKIGALLHIVEKSLGHPKLQSITNGAMAELMKIASELEYSQSEEKEAARLKAQEEGAKAAQEQAKPEQVGGDATTSSDNARRL